MEAGGAPADLWVFGYGSLMWRPGFPFVEERPGRLRGYHRSLCVLSHVHRGTPERPGLVLGLDRGGSCRGMAFRVAAAAAGETLAYLRAREQVTAVYVERRLGVTLDDGRRIEAVTYLVDRTHPQYAGRLPEADLLRLVRQGLGRSGPNPDYVRHTHDRLVALGIADPLLARVAAACAVPSP
ncbi:gamma-glutamylcyclotransferase [Methylobacterium oryzihabitans]|uniref:glutathione-specific gamma-glutamylcyclotransferase n=1 Tax=Methylobacterium oryzihabitans TaxID=2499852 RepID=A0A437PFJ6_9HYPH|nr:gamma-glutamylcyclotransferase [Methylobacterium oryzihabitans]RVU21049.1 gamma-glutamylcyclotransferase [Methylobacterium oryzihabitans]